MFLKPSTFKRSALSSLFSYWTVFRAYKTSVNSIRKGAIVELSNRPWRVVTPPQHHRTGRGGASVKVDLQDVVTGTKKTEKFGSQDSVEVLHLEDAKYIYTYMLSNVLHLHDPGTFEEIELSADMLEGDERTLALLEEGMPLTVGLLTTGDKTQPISFRLPYQWAYTISRVEERAGDSKTRGYKRATLSNGTHVEVPEFVAVGEKVVVEVAEMRYLKRL